MIYDVGRILTGRTLLSALCYLHLFLSSSCFGQGSNYGQFAPDDAYENGSPLAYYGSENEWSRRQFSAEAADRFIKRRGQRQLLAILDGQAGQAVLWCRQRLANDPTDLEALFNLTVAHCQLKEPDKAFTTMQRAVAAGLPLTRFLAGPRELLRSLTTSKKFQQLAAKHDLRLIHGPLLGCVTDHSARFWVRTADEVPVTIRVSLSASGDQRSSNHPTLTSTANTKKDADYTAIVEVTGLKPLTRYDYAVLVNGKPVALKPVPGFRTSAPAGTAGRFRIAFGGGAGFTPEHERIWDTIAAQHPDALFLLGDNVYIDLPEKPRGLHRYTYYRRQSRPEFRRLVSSTPVYAIWDDHDCAIDDIWMGPYLDRPSWKQSMLTIFKQNWNNPGYGNAQAPGCWFHTAMADVDFFFLDTRNYRTNPFGKHPEMLGPVQKAWLLNLLKNSQAQFKVIVSSVPWAPDAKPGSRDTWDGFVEEREEIFSFIQQQAIDGVILMSADRHRSDAWKIDRPQGYALYDLMSSRLTNIHTHECFEEALFCYNEKCSFGLLTFDTTQVDPQVEYQIVNIDGENIVSLSINKSQLTH